MASVSERFWAKVDKTGECWLWTGANVGGYGHINIGGRMVRSHRLSYEWANGPIPKGLVVCHRCDTPACVNPAHLFAGSQRDNHKDCYVKGRRTLPNGCHVSRTHCVNGHPLDGPQMRVYRYRGKDTRFCHTCRIDYLRRYRAEGRTHF